MLTSLSLQWGSDTACSAHTALCSQTLEFKVERLLCDQKHTQLADFTALFCCVSARNREERELYKHRWQKGKA